MKKGKKDKKDNKRKGSEAEIEIKMTLAVLE